MYGVLMILMLVLFIFMSLSYEYVPGSVRGYGDAEEEEEDEKAEKGERSGKENEAFSSVEEEKKMPLSNGVEVAQEKAVEDDDNTAL